MATTLVQTRYPFPACRAGRIARSPKHRSKDKPCA